MLWAIIVYLFFSFAMLGEFGLGAFLWPLAILAIPFVVNLFRF